MIRDPEITQAFLDSVRSFVNERLIPAENTVAETDQIPEDIVQEMKAMGLFGLTVPEEYGGLGVTMEEESLIMFEMGRTSPAFRSLFGTNNGIAGQVVARFGSDAQKQAWLPGLAAGELIGSFALTEPEAGSDPAGLRTTARRDGDGWVLNGAKRWIGNGTFCDHMVVWARDTETNKVLGFVVHRDNPGMATTKIENKIALRSVQNADVTFTDCRVPEADRLQEARSF